MWPEVVVGGSGFKFVGSICIVNYLFSCKLCNVKTTVKIASKLCIATQSSLPMWTIPKYFI